jgi:hypothetical protein
MVADLFTCDSKSAPQRTATPFLESFSRGMNIPKDLRPHNGQQLPQMGRSSPGVPFPEFSSKGLSVKALEGTFPRFHIHI